MSGGDVYNSDKIVNNVEILAQLSADFALTYTIFRAHIRHIVRSSLRQLSFLVLLCRGG